MLNNGSRTCVLHCTLSGNNSSAAFEHHISTVQHGPVSPGVPPVVPISIHEVSVRTTRHPVITSPCAGENVAECPPSDTPPLGFAAPRSPASVADVEPGRSGFPSDGSLLPRCAFTETDSRKLHKTSPLSSFEVIYLVSVSRTRYLSLLWMFVTVLTRSRLHFCDSR